MIFSCSSTSNKGVYWCGDHPCINNKEKEAYFKETMIVELKTIDKNNKENFSNLEKITKQAISDEKKRIKKEKELSKQVKIDEKIRLKNEKKLKKQRKKQEKLEMKNEANLENTVELEEKQKKNDNKKIVKIPKSTNEEKGELKIDTKYIKIDATKFKDLLEKISERNKLRPYPNINNIPNYNEK